MFSCCRKAQVRTGEDDIVDLKSSDLKTAEEKAIAVAIPAAVEINDDHRGDPDAYYAQYNFVYKAASSPEDLQLMSRDETESDRILDLAIVMDCTSSMSTWLELCKRTLTDAIDVVVKEYPELQVRVAFVGYRDFGDKNQIFVIQDFTFDVEGLKNLISQTKAKGGQDIPEDVQGGLFQTLKLNWRNVSVKICYLCTDAPCHGKVYHSLRDYYGDGNPAGLNLEDLMVEFSNKRIDLTVYELTPQTKNMYNIMEQAYNQGGNSGELKRITLEKEIEQAQAAHEDLTKIGGKLEMEYRENLNNDMKVRAMNQYARHGWTEDAFIGESERLIDMPRKEKKRK